MTRELGSRSSSAFSSLYRDDVVCICEKPVLSSGQDYKEPLATADSWLAGDFRSPRGPDWEQFSVNAHDVEANWLPCQVLAEAPW